MPGFGKSATSINVFRISSEMERLKLIYTGSD
jgi:hypothetical protein